MTKTTKIVDQKKSLVVLGIICVLFFAQGYHWFWSNFYFTFQSPIILERVVVSPLPKYTDPMDISPLPTGSITPTKGATNKVSPTPSRVVAPTKKKVEIPHVEIYQKVSMLESGQGRDLSGKHGTCVRSGKTNTIGYAPQTGYCFDNVQDEMMSLGNWFKKYFDKGYTLAQALCSWNLGPNDPRSKSGSCDYYKNYLTLR